METLEDKIKKFLTIDAGYGYGDGSGYGYGKGSGCGSGYGYGYGYGFGAGSDSDSDSGYGYGYGSGYGSDSDSGYGYGDDCGVKRINNHRVYMVDNTPTIITSIHDNIAQGFILQSDLQLKPCFIVKENNVFAHGDTLRDAFTSLQEKLYDDSVNL